ncbi:MAG: hypothetical protein V4620_03915 [Bacteroidota bacterium]
MRNFLLILILVGALFSNSCSNNGPTVSGLIDTSKWVLNAKGPTYDPKTPRLNAQVESNEQPNEYQEKKQTLSDGTVCMSWSNAGFKSGNEAIRFYQNLQLNIRYNEKDLIAKLIKFPLRDSTTKQEFLDRYNDIFDPEFRRELLEQNPFQLYRDSNGCMAGNDGQLWFKPKGQSFEIFELNW